jgi:(p)ppGpp synthase/HD superfamily hydrolase
MADLDDALRVAAQAHRSQKDRYGSPFILHPIRVMLRLAGEVEQIVALLHDVVERSPWTLADLRREGFSEEVISAVALLTKREGEPYLDYISRVRDNPLAAQVKQADLQDHIDVLCKNSLETGESERMQRYHEALQALRRPEEN